MGTLRTPRRIRAVLFIPFLASAALIVWRNPGRRPYSPDYGLVGPIVASSSFATVAFLGSDTAHKEEDKYFVACRVLICQLIYADKTRVKDEARGMVDWVVAVTSGVDAWKRE